jgi:hypothetical protein
MNFFLNNNTFLISIYFYVYLLLLFTLKVDSCNVCIIIENNKKIYKVVCYKNYIIVVIIIVYHIKTYEIYKK